MILFFRDQPIENLSIDEDAIRQIDEVFKSLIKTYYKSLTEPVDDGKKINYFYIIRFDGKGYRVFSIEELLSYFNQAKRIERVLFMLETSESLKTKRESGTFIELKLDQKDSKNCLLTVATNDKEWGNSSFAIIQDILSQYKNRHGFLRTGFTPFTLQIIGVIVAFLVSLGFAKKISPEVSVQNSFVICFFFTLIILSNMWSYISKQIISLIDFIFPNVRLYRRNKDHAHWITQAVLGGIALAITLWGISLIYSYFGNIIIDLTTKIT